MNTDSMSPSRRDLLLMTGVATAGALIATRKGEPAAAHTVTGSGGPVVNVRDHGAKGDGSTDDSDAIETVMRTASAGGGSATLYFPKGDYHIRGGKLRIPDGSPMIIRGDGPVATRITLLAGDSSGDALVTVDAEFSAVEDLQLDGGGLAGDAELLVMNRGYNRVSNCYLSGAPGTGLAIGKTNSALVHVLENVIIRDSNAYGIRVHAAAKNVPSGSTDGMWSNVDVGRSGLSGVLLESSSQNMTNVHVWQSGVRVDAGSDRHGFRVTSRSHLFTGCQSETNLGDGLRFESGGGEGCVVNGCRIWENGDAGLSGADAHRLTITGCTFMRNGRNNVGDAASATAPAAAAMRNEGGDAWSITGCNAWDDTKELAAVHAPRDSTASRIPARGAQMTQTFAYVETGAKGSSAISGGVLRAEEHLSGHSLQSSAALLKVTGADLGRDDVPRIASDDSVDLPAWGDVVEVTGTTPITAVAAGRPGRVVTLAFSAQSTGGLRDGSGTLRLGGDFRPKDGGSITLAFLDGGWREQSRTT